MSRWLEPLAKDEQLGDDGDQRASTQEGEVQSEEEEDSTKDLGRNYF